MLKLEIPKNVFKQMVKHARMQAPVEACGILAGKDGKVAKLYQMTNADQGSDHFMMEPAEQFAVARDIRAGGFEMLAIYHSHPETPARPSVEDVRLALTPGVINVIVSLQDSESSFIKSFIIEKCSSREVPVRILEEQK